MRISRRTFIGLAAGLSAGLVESRGNVGALAARHRERLQGCTLLDLGDRCGLAESRVGFAKALAAASVPFERVPLGNPIDAGTIIVPAVALANGNLGRALRESLDRGATVLFESGAAFLPPREFEVEQRWVQTHFGLTLHPPLNLWESAHDFGPVPYLDYTWPVETKIRDFSRVLPLSGPDGEVVARHGKVPVAVRQRFGCGTLIFLGSPLGPHLLAGDPQAHQWLREVLAQQPA